MNKPKILMMGALTALSFAAYLPAKADGPYKSGDDIYSGTRDTWLDWADYDNNNKSASGKGAGNSGAHSQPALPINSYAWFLTIAGSAIGYKVISDRVKMKRT